MIGETAKGLTVPVGPRDHIQGNPKAPLTLLEYGDYECGYCGKAYYEVKSVQESAGDDLCFAFRNFPLSQIHPNAIPAALAAEAAALQKKFWEMHDLLFENQKALDEENLVALAFALELDIPKFKVDMQSEEIASRVREDFMGGVRSGVNGTPTFFINGKRHDGSYEYDALLTALEKNAP